jgi:hypothetical protein
VPSGTFTVSRYSAIETLPRMLLTNRQTATVTRVK